MSEDRGEQGRRGGDLTFRAILSTLLFAYVGFVLAVVLADIVWLARPAEGGEGESGFDRLLSNEEALAEILGTLRLSLVTSLITSVAAMVVAIPSAYVLSRYRMPFPTVIDTLVDLPIVMPPLIAGLSLLIFFNQTAPGSFLNEWLEIVYTRRGIIVAQFFISSAFCIRAIKAALDQVNPRFEDVARSLGCGKVRAFVQITLPLAKSGLMAGWIMTWARTLGEFAPVMILAGARPWPQDDYTAVLPVSAFLNLSSGHVEISIAITVLMIAIAAVTLILFKKLGGRGYLW